MKKWISLVAALVLAIGIDASGYAQSDSVVAPGGAIYDNTSGVFLGFVNRVTGAEERLGRRTTGTGAPTCSSNCGTSPTVVGSDNAMLVTMGSTGVPTSGWVVTFNSAWRAAPACVAQMALTGMANTKLPIVLAITTTTITVTTNGAAPAASDAYTILCAGVN